jgi:two-component system sensor histidine kinase DesK
MTTPPADYSSVEPTTPTIEVAARLWGGVRWGRYIFPAFWLVYLGQTVQGVANHSHGVAAVAGYLLVVLFAATYLVALPMGRAGHTTWFWALYVLAYLETAAECLFARADALVFCVYIAVLTVATRRRWAPGVVLTLTAVAVVLPRLAWHEKPAWNTGLAVLLASIAMWGFFSVVQANIALSAARAEVARLAAENERSRIARDLHDLLGHSLTTITVKAGLARRLGERGETHRALQEITEVEQLARRTLGDVRAAVAGHRDVTLVGELATAREVLRAAAVIAEMPGSVDVVDPALSELFGWVVREGVTNVVRHARANHVRITLGPRSVEISDDGRGGTPGAGNGLAGLRERVEAAGGTMQATGGFTGFRLRVEVPTVPAPSAVAWHA